MMRNRLLAALLLVLLLAGCGAGSRKETTGAPSVKPSAPQVTSPTPTPPSPRESNPATTTESKSADAGQRAPSDMYFQNTGNNPNINPERQPVSTFAIDVDTASYTVARNYLERNTLPPPDAIRVEEFINYFPQRYPAPVKDAVAVHLEGAPNPFRPSLQLLQIGLKAREVDREERKPAILTFVIDVSGSMNMENRLGLVKQTLNLLVDQLDRRDKVGIVIYGSRGEVILEHTSDKERIRQAIGRLEPGGSTNAEEGLLLGYDLAHRAYQEGSINRVILCSDGVANVGRTGPEAILERVDEYRGRGITLTTVGFGMGNYNDVLMERLANKGDGQYAYVDSLEESRRFFGEQLTSTLQLVAKDAKVQVQFDGAEVLSYRLVGYENRVMRNEDFRNDAADAGEMGAGHEVTALYELSITQRSDRDLGYVSIRYLDPDTGITHERKVPIQRSQIARSPEAASPWLRWSAAVAEFGGILKESPWAVETRLADVEMVAARAARDLDEPPVFREFITMVQQARRLKGQ